MTDLNEREGITRLKRIEKTTKPGRHCRCGKPMPETACSECGDYAIIPAQILENFLDGTDPQWSQDLLRSMALLAVSVPNILEQLDSLNKDVRALAEYLDENDRQSWWSTWLGHATRIAGLVEWLWDWFERLLGFFIRRQRSKGKSNPTSQ